MNIPILGKLIDERFLNHRLRSTSIAGVIGGYVAVGLFAWHFYIDHVWNWDLFAVAITLVVVKLSVLTFYLLTD
jgi:hypothetical protein